MRQSQKFYHLNLDIMNFEPFNTSSETRDEASGEVKDDLEIPPGVEVDYDKMASTIRDMGHDKVSTQREESAPVVPPADDHTLPTPTTPRPQMPPAQDSQTPLVTNYPTELRRPKHYEQETSDDPEDDVMSINTDINRHDRSLSRISNQLDDMTKKVNLLPDLDMKIRTLSTRNNELESKITQVSHDMENLRKSFNMYQSSTANKIADVERRAAEKQLSTTATPSDDVIPPSEVNESRQTPVDTMTNRQPETLSQAPLAPVQKKKKAVIPDW